MMNEQGPKELKFSESVAFEIGTILVATIHTQQPAYN